MGRRVPGHLQGGRDHHARLRDPERKLYEALAKQPWVPALADWQMVRPEMAIALKRQNQAREFAGLAPMTISRLDLAATWSNGTPSPENLLRPLLRVVDGAAKAPGRRASTSPVCAADPLALLGLAGLVVPS